MTLGPDPAVGGELGIGPEELIAGRYQLLAMIGRGGMGSVYQVRDCELDEVVALKVLHRGLVGSPEMLDRFRQEVKLARRVTHTNVARTYDIGEHRGIRFLTMELVEGESLATLLERDGALQLDSALGIAAQMCSGMIAAHEAGVIHRDLKPENVCIAGDGRVVLMDFGIARGDLAGETDGAMLGTPAYMAPEQVNGVGLIDARTDIYSFGAVFYEMITGVLAWPGSSPFHVARARLTTPPPDPSSVLPELDPGVRALILGCLARAPEQRFADARALLRALGELIAPPAKGAPRPLPAADPTPRHLRDVTATPAGAGQGYQSKTGVDGFRDDIVQQRMLMGERCPPYTRVLDLLDAELAKGDAVERHFARVWQKRSFDGPYERTLLTLAALRHDALTEGPTHPLYDAIAAREPRAAAATETALLAALAPDRLGFWITLRSRRIQTNETSRALIWLWPAALAGCDDRKRTLAIADIGASAGLNLTAESLPLSWQRNGGGSIARATRMDIRARVGFEPRPLDPVRKEDQGWLEACIWPGDRVRTERLHAAIAAFQLVVPAPELHAKRALSVPGELEALSGRVGSRGLVIAYQSLVRDYIGTTERDAYESAMLDWLRRGAKGERAWVTLELADASVASFNCGIDVHVATGGEPARVRLGLTSYHPEVVDVVAGAEQKLVELFRSGA